MKSSLIVLAAIVAAAYGACQCAKEPTTAQDAFCQADWVMQAIFNFKLNSTANPQVVYHLTRIGEFYKWPKNVKQPLGISMTVNSNKTADGCGITLTPGVNYLLLGTLDAKNNMVTNSCLTMPTTDGQHSDEPAEYLHVDVKTRTDLLLKKIDCAAGGSSGTTQVPTTHHA